MKMRKFLERKVSKPSFLFRARRTFPSCQRMKDLRIDVHFSGMANEF